MCLPSVRNPFTYATCDNLHVVSKLLGGERVAPAAWQYPEALPGATKV
jgi:hypothetical protein